MLRISCRNASARSGPVPGVRPHTLETSLPRLFGYFLRWQHCMSGLQGQVSPKATPAPFALLGRHVGPAVMQRLRRPTRSRLNRLAKPVATSPPRDGRPQATAWRHARATPRALAKPGMELVERRHTRADFRIGRGRPATGSQSIDIVMRFWGMV